MELVIICGPTASGKSSLALDLARRIGGEIISADSMQLYRGIDIGTAKPGRADREAVRHHLLDLFEITERLDVFRYVELADKAICEIRSRGRIPIVSGGTGMYIRALVYGLDPLPSDSALRARLDAEYDSDAGFVRLRELMAEKDPADFARWRQHRRKLIRALEVYELTGKSITDLQKTWNGQPVYRHDAFSRTLVWDREVLRRRIVERTDEMLSSGWVEEAQSMIGKGLLRTPTAYQALGYRTIAEYLQGRISLGQMREMIITSTWQYARRQMTWFKNKNPESLPLQMPASAETLAEEIRGCFSRSI